MNPRQRLIHTPRYDAWLEELRTTLEPRGMKTELARHMAGERGQSFLSWRTIITEILGKKRMLNAEDLLAITAWTVARTDTTKET